MNLFNEIEIVCWGELRNKDNVQKICQNIVEAQQEVWRNPLEFFNSNIEQCKFKYQLLINDKCEIVSPQNYFLKTISILERIPQVSFIYTDYNEVLLPSFKPYIFRDKKLIAGFPLLIKNIKNKLCVQNSKEDYLIGAVRILSTHLIGHHIAEPLIRIYR